MANKTSNFPNAQHPELEPGGMGKMVLAMNELRELPKIDYRDSVALAGRIEYFFNWCVTNDLRPGVELLSLSLGTNRMSLWRWEREEGDRGEIIRQAKVLLAALLEQWSLTGRLNPITSRFLFMNHFFYTDSYQIEAGPINKLDSLKSKAEIIRSLPADVESPKDEPDDIDRLLGDVEST